MRRGNCFTAVGTTFYERRLKFHNQKNKKEKNTKKMSQKMKTEKKRQKQRQIQKKNTKKYKTRKLLRSIDTRKH